MTTESRFDDLDLREEPARDSDRAPQFLTSGLAQLNATVGCSKPCCTCPPPFA